MNTILIFACVWGALLAMSFWESSTEGRNAWDKGKLGWKLKIGKYYITTRYHFYIVYVMFPLLIFGLPFSLVGWDFKLFGMLFSAYTSGLVIQDFMWFVVNPVVKLSEWNPKFASYYPWIVLGRFRIPLYYIAGILLAVLSWAFIWRFG